MNSKYIYHGPMSGASINLSGTDRRKVEIQVLFHDGKQPVNIHNKPVLLPEDNAYVKRLVARGHLEKVMTEAEHLKSQQETQEKARADEKAAEKRRAKAEAESKQREQELQQARAEGRAEALAESKAEAGASKPSKGSQSKS